jgi:mRNA interferase RelE/StbE
MRYELAIMKRAVRELADLDRETAARILAKIEFLREDLAGDVKRLTNRWPGYRLRVGDYRVLFAVVDHKIEVHRVLHRRDAYRS